MKTRNLIFTALTALALSVLAGCSSETELPQEAPDAIPEGMARIEFAIKGVKTGTSYAASATVGLDPSERQINDVTAYLFKLAVGQSIIGDADLVDEVVATTVADGKASFLMPAAATENDRYAVVLVGNKACFNAAALAAVVKGSTYAALNAVETRENTAIIADLLNGGLPMRALTSITIPAGGGKVSVDAKFTRPLSRFDIDNRALHSFKITSVVLANARKTSPFNIAGTAGKVAGTPVDVEYSTFISDVNERLTPPDLNPDGSNSKLRPAFYASPALDGDNASLLVKGMLRSGLSEFPAEYVVPLVNKTTSAKIIIGANKRYRVTLTMDKDDNIVGDVMLDLGEWEDNDATNPDVEPDLSYQVGNINPATVKYAVETRTFNVPTNVTSFRFEVISDLGVVPAITGADNIVTSVTKVANINSRTVKLTSYEVVLKGVEGTGSFSFTTKDSKEYMFNVVSATPTTIPYPGFTEPAILVGDVYWAPVNIGAATVNEPGKLYQYGRMTGWNSAQEMVDNIGTNDGQVLTDDNWINPNDEAQKLVLQKWAAVSNGAADVPCPSGWRIPNVDDIPALLDVTDVSSETISADVSKVTVKGIPFISKEWFLAGSAQGGTSEHIQTGESGFMVAPMGIIFSRLVCTKTALNLHYFDGGYAGGNDGYYIRCVKDK